MLPQLANRTNKRKQLYEYPFWLHYSTLGTIERSRKLHKSLHLRD